MTSEQNSPSNKTAPTTNYRTHIAPVIILALTTLLVFTPSVRHEFILLWDDSSYLLANTAAQGFSAAHLKTAFTSYFGGNYAPLHIISYMLDYTFWGLNPAGYIMENILLHTLSGLLFYALLIRCGLSRMIAMAAAFIFLLHPVQVESVVWVAQRKNCLAMLFSLAAFHCYLTYRHSDNRSRQRTGYALSLFLFLCALLSKSAAIIMPVAFALYDLTYAPRNNRRQLVTDKIPYLVLAGLAAMIAMDSQTHERGWGGRTGYHGGSPLTTFYTMLPVVGRYLHNLFWPTQLSAFYQIPTKHAPDGETLVWLVLVCALIGLGVRLYRRQRPLFFWYALFFLGLAPVSQIVPIVTLMNDRYLYFPMLGGAPFVCTCAGLLMEQCRSRVFQRGSRLICGTALVALPLLSFERARVWQSSITLWSDTVAKAPGLILFRHHLAEEYFRRGQMDQAVAACQDTLQRWPDDQRALELAGTIMTRHGQTIDGREYLERLVNGHPDNLDALLMLAENYLATGETGPALKACRSVLQQNPASERAHACIDELNRAKGLQP